MNKSAITISCTSRSEKLREKAQNFARKHGYLFVETEPYTSDHTVIFSDDSVFLSSLSPDNKKRHRNQVDFLRGEVAHRLLPKNCSAKQPLARAVGVKGGFRPDIIDVTAGFGQDGVVLAHLGCSVTFIERSPIIHLLLKDGLERGSSSTQLKETIKLRTQLYWIDALKYLKSCDQPPYAIYMDPMYPVKKKSALNKLEMRIIRDITGDDHDSKELFCEALKRTGNRVVVKRPKWAKNIDKQQPSHQITMKNSRYDVYLKAHL